MKITILVEGKTETAFKPHMRAFLQSRLARRMPRLDLFPTPVDPERRKLKRRLRLFSAPAATQLSRSRMFTGTGDFVNSADAKAKMRSVGQLQEPRFHPHVAQYDFEAWLLPYWDEIKKLAETQQKCSLGTARDGEPQSSSLVPHTRTSFESVQCRDDYSKPRDANRILRGKDLGVAAAQCPEQRPSSTRSSRSAEANRFRSFYPTPFQVDHKSSKRGAVLAARTYVRGSQA